MGLPSASLFVALQRPPFHEFVRSINRTPVHSTNRTPLEHALEGHPASLSTAFTWWKSPQGHDYWHARAYMGVPLSEDDKTMLRRWLIIKDMPEAFVDEYMSDWRPDRAQDLRDIAAGTRSAGYLIGEFVWDATSQGHDHWRARCSGDVPLSDEDKEWLLALAELDDRITDDLKAGRLREGKYGVEVVPAADAAPAPAPAPAFSLAASFFKQATDARQELEAAISTLVQDFHKQYGATIHAVKVWDDSSVTVDARINRNLDDLF